jgi:hypothetical protein
MPLANSALTVLFTKVRLIQLLVAAHCLQVNKFMGRVGVLLTLRKLHKLSYQAVTFTSVNKKVTLG